MISVAPSQIRPRYSLIGALVQSVATIGLIYAWLIFNPEISWHQGTLIIGDLALLALPIYMALLIGTGFGGAAEILISFGTGLAIAGVAGLVTRGLLGSMVPIEALSLFVTAVVAAVIALRRPRVALASTPHIRHAVLILSIVVISIPLGYVLMSAWLAGTGPFPEIILSSDDAVHLSMLQALLASDKVPPMSLTYVGGFKLYHYGALESAAHLVRLAGIAPHVALSYISKPLWMASVTAAGWIALRRLAERDSTFLVGAALLATTLRSSHDYMHPRLRNLTALLQHLAGKDWEKVPYMQIKLPHAASMAALSLSWLAVALMLTWESITVRLMVALIVGCLSVLDVFYFASTGLVLGIWSMWQAYRQRNLSPLLPPCLALAIGILSQHSTSSVAAGFSIGFTLFGNDYIRENSIDTLISCLPFFAMVALAYFVNRTAKICELALVLSVNIISLVLIANLLTLDYSTAGDNNFNWVRWISLIPVLSGVAAVFAWGGIFEQGRSWPKWMAILLLIYAVPLQLIRYPVAGLQALANPQRGDMNVDTASLAEVLRQIPVKDSLIVASDLRYPVVDYRYLDKNPLISALYGHRCYLCNWNGDQDIAGAEQRFDEVKLLRSDIWPPELNAIAAKNGWTHLIIHKDGPHAKEIPLPLVFENEDYQLYRFPK